jgi:hypothetical protein
MGAKRLLPQLGCSGAGIMCPMRVITRGYISLILPTGLRSVSGAPKPRSQVILLRPVVLVDKRQQVLQKARP